MATKAVRLVCYLLFRLLLPVILFASAAARYNGLSFLYTVLLLICPLLCSPTVTSIRGGTGVYLRVVFIFSLLASLAHAVFHITLKAIATDDKPYGSMFPNCSSNEKIARQIGLQRLDGVDAVDIIRLIVPDVAVFITSLLVYIICRKLLPVEPAKTGDQLPTVVQTNTRQRLHWALEFLGEFWLTLLFAASGIIVPSALAALYFLTFLFMVTLWSLYGYPGRKFAIFRVLALFYSGAHILVLYLYQFQFFQEEVHPDGFIPRLLGLTALVDTSCASPEKVILHDVSNWPHFVNPAILLVLYYTLAFQVRWHCNGKGSVSDVTNGEPGVQKQRRRKHRRSDERQVDTNLDESQKEHLVESEVRDYNAIEPVEGRRDRTGSESMLANMEDEDPEDEMDRPAKMRHGKRAPVVTALVYVMNQSYVLALIAMMVCAADGVYVFCWCLVSEFTSFLQDKAWSITFHSWLTFVLLMAACIIWMFPQSRRVCSIVSPIILFYAICLLIMQYVYGLNLTDSELPVESNGVNLSNVGLKKFTYPCLQLALQVFYTLMFWLTLRQYMRERRRAVLIEGEKYQLDPVNSESTSQRGPAASTSPKSLSEMLNFSADHVDGYDGNTMRAIGLDVLHMLSKYWILVCTIMMLLISLQEVVIYRIIYMILLLLFVLSFQLSYRFWRLTMFAFWWVVIVYSMLVLILLYTYQFDNISHAWANSSGLTPETLQDLGLEKFDTIELFIRLLTPTAFLIFIIIQVHYFHKNFLEISDMDRFKHAVTGTPAAADAATTPEDETKPQENPSLGKRFNLLLRKAWLCMSEWWEATTRLLWRMAQIHVFKVVTFVIIMVMVHEVSAISAVYVILLSVLLPLTGCHFLLSHISQFWTIIVLLAKMIFQLNLVDKSYLLSNCTGNLSTVSPFDEQIDSAIWIGLHQVNRNESVMYYLQNYVGVMLILVFERITVYHQRQHYNRPGLVKPKTGIIFPEVKRPQADDGILPCIQYFLNYFFYKFGLEVCYIMTAITVCVRVDVMSVLYSLFLGLLLLLSRRGNAIVWPVYTIVLVILLPVQFLLTLGLPRILCYEYLWDQKGALSRSLEKWLYLPDYLYGPDPHKLIADFFQLLFVCLQWRVFRQEMSHPADQEPDGGTNKEIIAEVEAGSKIPVEDFTTKITSYLDIIKNFVFTYMFWVTLAIVFLAGSTRINLFSLGYFILVFWFMWFGTEYIIKPIRKLVRGWNFLLGYCYIVLLLKAGLQLPGCVYIQALLDHACWLIQLLGLTCLRPAHDYPMQAVAKCSVEQDNTGLAWDVVCFTFLLLQKRIYLSHYFRHVVADYEAQNVLASRGCQLINRILRREVAKQKADEGQILANIKKKMEKLKERQAKQKQDYIEPEDHFQAIRSGDYYLFEDTEEDVESIDDEQPDILTFGQDKPKEGEGEEGPSPLQLITTAVHSGTDEAVKKAEEAEQAAESDRPSSPSQGHTSAGDGQTSHDGGGSGDQSGDQGQLEGDGDKEEEKGGIGQKIAGKLEFICALVASCSDWLTNQFNRISYTDRLVADRLQKDHVVVKQMQFTDLDQKFTLDQMASNSLSDQGPPSSLFLRDKMLEKQQALKDPVELQERSVKVEGTPEGETPAGTSADLVEVTVSEPAKTEDVVVPVRSELSLAALDEEKFDEEEEFEGGDQRRVYRLLKATYFVLVGRTQLLCYFLMFLNHILSASLLSLPLPMFVFLWGMLSVPRPTKTFWITVITYSEAVVVVKYVFQFGFFPWNDKVAGDGPYWPPRIIGIEQKDSFATMDLALLLSLFIHRIFLKRYGLWKDADEADEIDSSKKVSSRSSIEESQEEGTANKGAAPVKDTSALEEGCAEESDNKGDNLGEKKSVGRRLVQPFTDFYRQLTCPDYSATTDVYASMFLCDFISFLIILFGANAFSSAQMAGGGDVTSYISEDRIPVPFLIMLLTQFVLIVIDRALYLKKNVLGKFIFQILLVILFHLWFFFLLPYITQRPFTENKLAQLWYFVKCVYFTLSAYQIRSAYPTRILGNFLTKKYNYLNLFLFKGFLAIPFLLELRSLMDWMWTNTTMAVGSWLQMEDIYANIYVLKCNRVIEKNHPTPRAQPKGAVIKYGVGGLLLFIIIFILWFPLVIFSFANTVYEPNPPKECTVSLALTGYQPLFRLTGHGENFHFYTEGQYQKLHSLYDKNGAAVSFLGNYDAHDLSLVQLDGDSTSLWGISPPNLVQLKNDLQNPAVPITMEFLITFIRQPSSAAETLSQQFSKTLTQAEKNATFNMLNSTAGQHVTISNVYPEYIRLGSKVASPVAQLLGKGRAEYTDINMTLKYDPADNVTSWWEVVDMKDGHKLLTWTTFNDRVAPAGFSLITGYGIIGLYVSLVLVIGRFVRTMFSGSSTQIMFEELPYVDGIMALCLNLYMARECGDYRLEEQLFSKLLFLYRSTETMIRFTRWKQD